MATYPTNTVANFKTRLPNSLEFDGQWEFAMTEIIYPRSWYNISKDDYYIDVAWGALGSGLRFAVPEGHYDDITELIEATGAAAKRKISNRIRRNADSGGGGEGNDVTDGKNDYNSFKDDHDDDDHDNAMTVVTVCGGVQFRLLRKTQRVYIKVAANVRVRLSLSLAQTLGFEQCDLRGGRTHASNSPADINRGLSTIFMYCDIARVSIVGDTKVPLIRTLNVEGQYGDIVQKVYNRPVYVPLQRTHFDTVEINIRTDTGKLVPFVGGKAIVTLHFRRCTNPYFLPLPSR